MTEFNEELYYSFLDHLQPQYVRCIDVFVMEHIKVFHSAFKAIVYIVLGKVKVL